MLAVLRLQELHIPGLVVVAPLVLLLGGLLVLLAVRSCADSCCHGRYESSSSARGLPISRADTEASRMPSAGPSGTVPDEHTALLTVVAPRPTRPRHAKHLSVQVYDMPALPVPPAVTRFSRRELAWRVFLYAANLGVDTTVAVAYGRLGAETYYYMLVALMVLGQVAVAAVIYSMTQTGGTGWLGNAYASGV